MPRPAIGILALAAAATLGSSRASGQSRVMGIDVSEFQGTVNWTTVKNLGGKGFAFTRSSRGGTTGSSTASGGNTVGLGRYDDTAFYTNIFNSKAAGVYAGPYHYSRADINTSPNISTGADEATHFLQRAGAYMKPGYLLPVLDLEQGSGRSVTDLSNWCIDFANTIYASTGVYPIIYMNSSYAMDEVNSSVVTKMPNQWIARPDATSNPATGEPIPASAHLTPATGLWPTWRFWQYDTPTSDPSAISVPGISGEVDLDVAHGTLEYVQDYLVPAYWTAPASGSWGAVANWNSNNPAYNGSASSGPPSRAPGNVSGTPNLSGIDDTVILDNTMTTAAYTVTLDSGTFNIRKLYVRRPLNITGGTLTINYDPTTADAIGSGTTIVGSTTFSAQFSNPVMMSGGALSVHTAVVDPANVFTVSGGSLAFTKLSLTAGASPARLVVGGDVTMGPSTTAAGAVVTSSSTTNPGTIDLAGGRRTIVVTDGTAAAADLTFDTTAGNGSIVKAGPGTMQLNRATSFTSAVAVNAGTLIATQNAQLGPGASVGTGGALRLAGSLSYAVPLTLSGSGVAAQPGTAPGNPGALQVSSGSATWAGNVTLMGAGSNSTDPTFNTVSAASGATLTVSGVISSGLFGALAGLAKSDNGTLVLAGAPANTYTGATNVYGGQLVVAKNGALGTAASHTYELAGSASTIAFSSGTSLNYTLAEYIHSEGTAGAQVDNLAGNNTFAGSIAIGGPTVAGAVTGSVGVSGGSLTLAGGLYARTGYASNVRTINKTGPGTLYLTGDSSIAPVGSASAAALVNSTLNVTGGFVELHGPGAGTANVPGISTYNVSAGASLVNAAGTLSNAAINASGLFSQNDARLQNVGLTVNSGALAKFNPTGVAPSVLSLLTINGTGTLDLTTSDLAIDYSGASVADAVRQKLLSGRNGGNWLGAGIVSSSANPNSEPQARTAIGYGEASAVLGLGGSQTGNWDGAAVDATTLLLKYTWYGDANLDGTITADDLALLDRGYANHLTGWVNGDFNYDNVVDQNDYLLIDRVAGQQSGTLSPTLLADREARFGSGYVEALVAAAPEPGAAGALLVAGCALVGRRRRTVS